MTTAYGLIPIFINDAGEREYLLLQSHHGFWGFPKGHPEAGETPVQSALREAEEEVGIIADPADLGAPLSYGYGQSPADLAPTKQVVLYPVLVSSKDVTLQVEEIADYEWVNIDRAIELINLSAASDGLLAMSRRDPRVDSIIAGLPSWQAAICERVRSIVLQADPEVAETIKRSKLPFYVLQGNICALQATKDHVNILIYDPVAPDPAGIINQGHGNATARAIQVYENDELNDAALTELLKAVIANNRAGGWRKLV